MDVQAKVHTCQLSRIQFHFSPDLAPLCYCINHFSISLDSPSFSLALMILSNSVINKLWTSHSIIVVHMISDARKRLASTRHQSEKLLHSNGAKINKTTYLRISCFKRLYRLFFSFGQQEPRCSLDEDCILETFSTCSLAWRNGSDILIQLFFRPLMFCGCFRTIYYVVNFFLSLQISYEAGVDFTVGCWRSESSHASVM
jgi:hypothetical protein